MPKLTILYTHRHTYITVTVDITANLSLSLSPSLRFNGHLPDEPGLAGVY